MGKYDDIINLSHHISVKHPHMNIESRAAQFAPFAALTGFDDSIDEIGRLTCDKIELDEQHKEALDVALNTVINNQNLKIRIIYFVPDILKDGGEYVSLEGFFKKIDDLKTKITMMDNTVILIDDIYSINLCN